MQTYLSVFHRTCWKTPLWGIRTDCRCSWRSLSSRLSPRSWTSRNGWPSSSLKSNSSRAASVTVTSVRSEPTALHTHTHTHTGYFKAWPTQKTQWFGFTRYFGRQCERTWAVSVIKLLFSTFRLSRNSFDKDVSLPGWWVVSESNCRRNY